MRGQKASHTANEGQYANIKNRPLYDEDMNLDMRFKLFELFGRCFLIKEKKPRKIICLGSAAMGSATYGVLYVLSKTFEGFFLNRYDGMTAWLIRVVASFCVTFILLTTGVGVYKAFKFVKRGKSVDEK